MYDFLGDRRFDRIKPLEKRAHLAIVTLHEEDEMKYIKAVYDENYLTTEGSNVNGLEATVAEYMTTAGGQKRLLPSVMIPQLYI